MSAPRDYSWGGGWYGSAASTKTQAKDTAATTSGATADVAWAAVSLLLSGMILYGGAGWLLGSWLGRPAAFAGAGVLAGTAFALVMINARIRRLAAGSSSTPAADRR